MWASSMLGGGNLLVTECKSLGILQEKIDEIQVQSIHKIRSFIVIIFI